MHYDFDINTHSYMDYRRQWADDPMPVGDWVTHEYDTREWGTARKYVRQTPLRGHMASVEWFQGYRMDGTFAPIRLSVIAHMRPEAGVYFPKIELLDTNNIIDGLEWADFHLRMYGWTVPECDYMALEDIPKPLGFR